MSETRSSRRKNIGFKKEGLNQAHDAVFAVLDALPRGSASDFVVLAVMEFLQNHAGQTIKSSRKCKYIILGSSENRSVTHQPEPSTKEIEKECQAVNAFLKSETPVPPKAVASIAAVKEEAINTLNAGLDEETLFGLVMGFIGDR